MFYRLCLVLAFAGLLVGNAPADPITLHPRNADPITGEILGEPAEAGIRLRLGEDLSSITKPIPWASLSQDDLKQLQTVFAQKSAVLQMIDPFIEIPAAVTREKTDIGTTNAVPRLDRPAKQSLFVALGGSSAGMLMLLFLYVGNLYAAYEISVFRAQPAGLVCGLAAVLPILGPVIFLAMPTRTNQGAQENYEAPDANLEAAIAAEQAAPPANQGRGAPRHPATQAVTGAAAANAPAGKSFVRGQFTFNRRFFETQVPGFFALMRPAADKDMLLTFKVARGNYTAERITRISGTDLHIQIRKGNATEEVTFPFSEIQEVHVKHKDA